MVMHTCYLSPWDTEAERSQDEARSANLYCVTILDFIRERGKVTIGILFGMKKNKLCGLLNFKMCYTRTHHLSKPE